MNAFTRIGPDQRKRVRSLDTNSEKVSTFYQQYRFLAENRHLDLVSRVFHDLPGRSTSVSWGRSELGSEPQGHGRERMLHFGSYNYSGLNGHPRVLAAAKLALERYGTTISGVRLLNGTSELHLQLERALADFLGFEDCITFSSGYLANVSVLAALCDESDVILSDMLNHRSIVDGMRLSGADVRVYRHRSARSVESQLGKLAWEQRKLIVTDGVFSMDGDLADLPSLVQAAERHNAFIVVDDAHGTAAVGPHGRGTAAHFGLEGEVDVLLGSLSKGLPGIGGFAAGSKRTIDSLRFGSHGYIFSAALPPVIVAGLIAAIEVLEEEPQIQASLHASERYLRDGLRALGFDTMSSETPIIPVLMPTPETAGEMARCLHRRGIYVNPVVYPAVSRNRARLRINVSANLTREDLDLCLDAFAESWAELGFSESVRTVSPEAAAEA